MLNRGPGDINVLANRPKVLEDIVKDNYPEYRYMMFMMPILLNAHCVVETGLGWGHSSRIHLDSLSHLDGERELHTYEIDHQYEGIIADIKSLNLKAKWYLHYQDSVDAGRHWTGIPIELLYLDSDHSYEHVSNELHAWSPYMTQKAVIYGDDTWAENAPHAAINKRNPGQFPTDVYWAFHDFAATHSEWKELNFSYPQGKTILYRGL